jgi:hypothetical protein
MHSMMLAEELRGIKRKVANPYTGTSFFCAFEPAPDQVPAGPAPNGQGQQSNRKYRTNSAQVPQGLTWAIKKAIVQAIVDERRRCLPLMTFDPTINLGNGREPHISLSTRGERLKKGSFVPPRLGPRGLTQTDKLRSRSCTMRVFKIYVKSILTGLATLFAALLLACIILIPRSWIGGVDGRSILVVSFLVFAVGFFWQYLRLSHKGSA